MDDSSNQNQSNTQRDSLTFELFNLLKAVGHGPWGIAGLVLAVAAALLCLAAFGVRWA